MSDAITPQEKTEICQNSIRALMHTIDVSANSPGRDNSTKVLYLGIPQTIFLSAIRIPLYELVDELIVLSRDRGAEDGMLELVDSFLKQASKFSAMDPFEWQYERYDRFCENDPDIELLKCELRDFQGIRSFAEMISLALLIPIACNSTTDAGLSICTSAVLEFAPFMNLNNYRRLQAPTHLRENSVPIYSKPVGVCGHKLPFPHPPTMHNSSEFDIRVRILESQLASAASVMQLLKSHRDYLSSMSKPNQVYERILIQVEEFVWEKLGPMSVGDARLLQDITLWRRDQTHTGPIRVLSRSYWKAGL
ncbi:hypothetical protein DFP72DRAFT_849189 [Ephemerocybe angulata]|uniref:Uncharacterized protein n=1 Tax=Ephemerocybe angulata TaxID=980116 RepID=A0A8H6HTZ1_9AGAR|nr:hypothetical protein DFP72DRAFT_849189 [Tulosesus angulatus]